MGNGDSPTAREREIATQLAEGAKSTTVTAEKLLGEQRFYYNVIGFLSQDEQPHFLFPLTAGLIHDPPLTIQQGENTRKPISGNIGSVVVTDQQIRIHSGAGEWTFPYHSIDAINRIGYPGLKIEMSAKSYFIRVSRMHYDFDEDLALAVNSIRELLQDDRSSDTTSDSQTGSDTNPVETLEKLQEMYENELITDEEYQSKRQEVLDRM